MTSQEFLARHRMPADVQAFIDAYGEKLGLRAYQSFILYRVIERELRREREAAIEVKVRQDAILELLAERNLRIPRVVRAEIRQCTSTSRLRTMHRRALRVKTAEDVLTRKRLPTAG